eukprot:CAMPEP_0202692278 /NCGR_PEP_ID=MMETSP1385-20130828/6696_1 /ASSEMBLY_ACC=CAM_ASM_000861 /TAXON_ID=933848 /ORGANISM="Elphidium margaritaceum" /LENGTH=253 /DNA_ID=CAMNT_0049347775 /DNA_START=597 /DNA_END=1354 /DNA_ORIENTATION=-
MCSPRKAVFDLAHQRSVDLLEERKGLRECSASPIRDVNGYHMRMVIALQDLRMFHQFMQRLLKGHCAECLLSSIEFIQFSNKCYADFTDGNDDEMSVVRNIDYNKCRSNSSTLDVPNTAMDHMDAHIISPKSFNDSHLILPRDEQFPKSSIVFKPRHLESGDDDQVRIKLNMSYSVHDYKLIAAQMYEKYIAYDAEYEINIDGFNKRKYQKLMSNTDVWLSNKRFDNLLALSTLFQPCLDQMSSLMLASFLNW